MPYIVIGLKEEPAIFMRKGPIRTGNKIVYLDKLSSPNTLQVRMVCRDLTIFCRSGQIFNRIADEIDKIC